MPRNRPKPRDQSQHWINRPNKYIRSKPLKWIKVVTDKAGKEIFKQTEKKGRNELDIDQLENEILNGNFDFMKGDYWDENTLEQKITSIAYELVNIDQSLEEAIEKLESDERLINELQELIKETENNIDRLKNISYMLKSKRMIFIDAIRRIFDDAKEERKKDVMKETDDDFEFEEVDR